MENRHFGNYSQCKNDKRNCIIAAVNQNTSQSFPFIISLHGRIRGYYLITAKSKSHAINLATEAEKLQVWKAVGMTDC